VAKVKKKSNVTKKVYNFRYKNAVAKYFKIIAIESLFTTKADTENKPNSSRSYQNAKKTYLKYN